MKSSGTEQHQRHITQEMVQQKKQNNKRDRTTKETYAPT